MRDYEGHWYKVVQIGTQCWLKENMRAKIYSDGSQLPDGGNSDPSDSKRYYYEAYGKADSTKKYGYLYNWAAAVNCSNPSDALNNSENNNFEMAQSICPTGWHVPTNGDWVTMETFLNGGTALNYGINQYLGTFAGKVACGAWNSSGYSQDNTTTSTPGNPYYLYRNTTGFSALPADESVFGLRARFWTSTNASNTQTYTKISRWLFRTNPGIRYAADGANNKFSVRCIRD